ncbi:MAG: class I SAM-dependent methyltransferase [Candidatus Omnitrophota bacterium]
MRTLKDENIDAVTKKAWEDNWRGVEIETIMEIFRYPRVQQHMRIYLKYLPKDRKVLEGGCGLGPYLVQLKRLGYDVLGVDYNAAPLRKLQEYDRALPVFCADVKDLPFRDGYFGGYLSLGVIEHFTEGPERSIKEAWRVLDEGGIFIVKVPRTSIFARIAYPLESLKRNAFMRKLFGKAPLERYWEQHFSVKELSGALEKNGFEILEITPVDHEHALMTFCGLLRDKGSYDGANRFGIALSRFCMRRMPWLTAAEVIFVCRKKVR